MNLRGVLKLNGANGRAELAAGGEVFSFPGRMAGEAVKIAIPEGEQVRASDPAAAAGASAQATRGVLRMQNGRAELALASGEIVSFPARYAGRAIGIDTVDLATEAARLFTRGASSLAMPPATPPATPFGRYIVAGERHLLQNPFSDEDLDVLA